MEDVIVVSSDSSAPNSPICESRLNRNLDDDHHDTDGKSDSTIIYDTEEQNLELDNIRLGDTKESESHNLGPSGSGVSNVASENGMDCVDLLNESNDESDCTDIDFPPVNFTTQSKAGTSGGSNYGITAQLERAQNSDLEVSNSDEEKQSDQKGTRGTNSKTSSQSSDYASRNSKTSSQSSDYVSRNSKTSTQSSDYGSENSSDKGRRKRKTNAADAEKELRKAERIQNKVLKQAQQAQTKAEKLAAVETYRSQKPGECLKYIQTCLDQQLLMTECGGELLASLQREGIQCNIQSNPVPLSIFWTREIQQRSVGGDRKVHVTSEEQEEEEMLVVWDWEKVVRLIASKDLMPQLQRVQSIAPGKRLTLIVYGAEAYFRYQKTNKRRDVREQVLGNEGKTKPSKKDACFDNAPRISRDDWETAMTELYLFANCGHRQIEKPQDLGLFVRQFTKAVAEKPFKREKQRREQEKFQWYAAGDSRDCVRVDKNGNGLLRLWQQQLSQFSRVGMETAQAITNVYRSPRALIEAYENCSSQEAAELLLESIPIRRGVGPLTTTRKVGQDLSRKVYTFFTAMDGDTPLSSK